MDSSRLIASIAVALDKLQYLRKQSISRSDEMIFEYLRQQSIIRSEEMIFEIIRRLKVVRTFLLCSAQLTEGNNDILCSQKQMVMKQDNIRMREDLGSFLARFKDVIQNILDDHIPYDPIYFGYDMIYCEEEMDSWYTRLSDYLKKYPASPSANQIKAIMDSVLEILKDCLSSRRGYDIQLKEQLEALKKNITAMRNIICFGTLFRTETQEFQCLLNHIEPLAISAAHLTHLFHAKGPMHLPNDVISSMVSALLLKISHVGNPLLHEKYIEALASLKHSRELCDSTLDLNDCPFTVKMEHCIVSLSDTLWEMLHMVTRVSLKELELYDRLRLLIILLKRQPDRFDDDKIRDLTAAAVSEAGVRIFSLSQKDLVSDQCFQDNSEVIWAEVLEVKVEETSRFNFCKTNVLGFLDFLLEEYLMEVNSSKVDSYTLCCVPKIKEHLIFLKCCMGKLVELRYRQENLYQDVWNLVVQMAYKIEFLIDQLVLGDVLDSFPMSLESITEHLMILKALNIFNDGGRQETIKVQPVTWSSANKVRSINSIHVADEVVGFESEKASIVDRLMAGFKKLQVVAVVGMPGLGKTTLATKVYRDSSVTHHFSVKAWCSISQVFVRRKVLLELLNQIQPGKSNLTLNEDDLSQQLWRSLKTHRYLIFIDDIWDTKAFDLLMKSLPDDCNQSRILLTSRHSDVVSEALLDDKPLFLRLLTMDESLELLQRKLFPDQKDWPSKLHKVGMEIAEYCKGLPLTVVIIAGILKTTKQKGWKDVVKTLRSSNISDVTDQCESTLELSYRHLPDHLKPCFLWFGAFPEDHEFSVERMIWLWIAEGLVHKNESKSLEEVGRDYMNILIGRSLVMSAGRRSTGGVKTCHIHDLLHDFCLRKGNEESFIHISNGDGRREQEEVEIDLKRKVLFFRPTESYQKLDLSYIFRMFKLLRVLGIEKVELTGFPREIGALVQLRYLAIHVDIVGPEIGNLPNLETLILKSALLVVFLPDTVWNLQKLRHLYSKPSFIEFPIDNLDNSCNMVELETLSALCVSDLSILEKQLRKFPNIRHMKLCGSVNDNCSIDLSFLTQLESLSWRDCNSVMQVIFSENIKRLALSGNDLPWNEFSSFAKLPNLEALKLIGWEFIGDTWHIEEGEFAKLKFLKLHSESLIKWTAASDDLFPNLERLVLGLCRDLEEIPECLENVPTLEMIEVNYCPARIASLAKKVYEAQKAVGYDLQFHVENELYLLII